MAQLDLALLGPFQASLDGEPIAASTSSKARALLAYLALESHCVHDRHALAELLWLDYAPDVALTNLRNTLSRLRSAIGDRQQDPPFLLITRDAVRFNPDSAHHLDVRTLLQLVRGDLAIADLERAVALYRGGFLADLSLSGCAPFEEWAQLKAEELQRAFLGALAHLAEVREARDDLDGALDCARRRLAEAPWLEAAHCQTMRLLALLGRRSEAMVQFKHCREMLAAEFGAEPAAATLQLYALICHDALLPLPAVHELRLA